MNLVNDPIFDPDNEYSKLKEQKGIDIYSVAPHCMSGSGDFSPDEIKEFDKNWEFQVNDIIKSTFNNVINVFNEKNIFYFGCPIKVYKLNYYLRLNQFLKLYIDATEKDFILSEIKFLNDIIFDIQNSEQSHDGFSKTGKDIFEKAYEIISLIGYEQYAISHNKKIEFLEKKLNKKKSQIQTFIDDILEGKYSYFDAVKYIEVNTTPQTNTIFKREFTDVYQQTLVKFLDEVNESDIKDAIVNTKAEYLPFIYVDESETMYVNHFIKEISGTKTIRNSFGLSTTFKLNSIKCVNLNELMIDYFDDFSSGFIDGYENIRLLRKVFNYIYPKLKSTVDIEPLSEVNHIESSNIETKNESENSIKQIEKPNLQEAQLSPEKLITEAFEDLKDKFKSDDDYSLLIYAYTFYFTNNEFPFLERPIQFKTINKKKIGWILKVIYKNITDKDINYEYLLFAKNNINLFMNDELNKDDFLNCNLYKYFTTKV